MGQRKSSKKQNPPSANHPSDANTIASSQAVEVLEPHFNASIDSGSPFQAEPNTLQLTHSHPITADPHLIEYGDRAGASSDPLASEISQGLCVSLSLEASEGYNTVDPFSLYTNNPAQYTLHLAGSATSPAYPIDSRNTFTSETPAVPSRDATRHQTLFQYISPYQLFGTSEELSGPGSSIDNASLKSGHTSPKTLEERDTSSIFDPETEDAAATPSFPSPPSYSNNKAKRKRKETDKLNEIKYSGKLKARFDALAFVLKEGSRSLNRPACLQKAAQCITQLRADNVKLIDDNRKLKEEKDQLTEENKKLHEQRMLSVTHNSTSYAVPRV